MRTITAPLLRHPWLRCVRTPNRMTRCGLALVLVVTATSFALAAVPASASTPVEYVALGDSYTAAPLVPTQIASAGLCLRSTQNYPHLLAGAMHAAVFRDASCSGAATHDLSRSQKLTVGSNAAQFNRLTGSTSVVTLEIGGNDIGFVSILLHCASAVPWGSPCQHRYVKAGDDTIADSIATTGARIGSALDNIRARAPHARVFVIGYPAILPDTGRGCWPVMPIAWSDVPYLRAKEKQLNSAIATAAGAHRARYVDVYPPSIHHDACSTISARWVEPVLPAHSAAPVHPNAAGERGMANALKAAMGI